MRLEAFLTDLLYDHDCVIIPGFGGLVANYRPARLNKVTHVIKPPSKHVGFNRNLTHNDGLLVSHIARIINRSYNEVQAEVEELVAGYHQQLLQGERVVWQGIGLIFRDRSGSMQFVPQEQENFLLDAYGLVPVQLRAIVRTTEGETEVQVIPTRRTASGWMKAAAAVSVPLLAAGIWLWFNHTGADRGFELASINPLKWMHQRADYLPDVPRPELASWDTTEVAGWESLFDKPGIRVNLLTGEEDARGVEVAASGPVSPVKSSSSHTVKSSAYIVVAGAFEVLENADRFISQLNASGVQAFRAGQRGRLHLVGVASASSDKDARAAMSELRGRTNLSVWLLKR